jgi:cytochrome c-type biogenesis protein CcmH
MRLVPSFLLPLAFALAVSGPRSAAASPQAAVPNPETEARAIEAMLIAPCCFSQQVSVHASPAADEVRRDVRARLAAGETRRQILDGYVARYGKRILAVPPPTGFDATLYVTPAVVFLASAVLGLLAIRRFTRRTSTEPARSGTPAAAGGGSAEDEARLDDELRDLD